MGKCTCGDRYYQAQVHAEGCPALLKTATKPIASEGLIERLRQLRVVLKSGDYDGADLMRAWCAMMDAADALESTNRQLLLCREALESIECELSKVPINRAASLDFIQRTIRKALEGSCPDVVGGEK